MVSERPPEQASEAPIPTPPGFSPASAAAHAESQRNDHSRQLIWALLGVVLLLALFVVFVLPYMTDHRRDSPAVAERSVTPAPGLVVDNSVARNDAQQALQAYLRQRSRPQLSNADQWGDPQWSAATQIAAEGDRLLGRALYAQARQAYLQAGGLLQELEENRQQIFDACLKRADALLADNQAGPAAEQYQLALLMEPGHSGAQKGLDRAQVRDQLLNHMQSGEQAETAGRLDEAVAGYRSAIVLDADWQPAQDALARVEKTQTEKRFLQAVNQALESLDAGRLEDSAKALQRAVLIHPDAPVIADLQSRLATQRKQASLASLRERSRQRVGEEDWSSATALYRKALEIEPQNSFATAGLARALERERLHQQLDHYLVEPSRIYSTQPLANAERLLASNTSVPESEPKLRNKVARLEGLVQSASQPQEVVLRSDGHTEIVIYHLRKLGAFTEKRLSLLPGKYTAVGSRAGYRDVRRVFMVLPGKPVPPVTLHCEEAL